MKLVSRPEIGGTYNRYNTETLYHFRQQNRIGEYGELLMINNYPDELAKNILSNKYDLDVLKNSKTMELKSDTYRMASYFSFANHCTQNFFMEVTSNDNKMSIGGPFQAYRNLVDLFGYLYLPDNVWFCFDLNVLIKRLTELLSTYRWDLKRIKNDGYYTEGYAMPRHLFKDIYTMYDLGQEVNFFK
jgi:hypothetical protein